MNAAPSPLVRPIVAADLDAVLAIAAASPEAPHWRPADYAPYLADTPDANPALPRIAFAASRAGAITGFAAATLRPDPEAADAARGCHLCELDSIAVHPEERRQGIAAALLSAVLAWAAAHQARRLVLEVRASNAAALRLYERFGFRTEGHRPRYYAHPEEDALLLDIPVTPGSTIGAISTEIVIEGGRPRC
ncbi:MAG TPA: GNAT family N-acetyltransferase [Acidobacteriaceae bacterium]|jgi:ribosomal-protein-alanine N-acetyltransferase|nr:GNAT family N-acetyltransferase [Acidobacteriaceae bacterium]